MSFSSTLLLAFLGLLIHGPLGALFGGVIGLIFDINRAGQRRHVPANNGFIAPLFTLLGAVAKADGRVSEKEIAIAERLMARMRLDTAQRQLAITNFNEGKQSDFKVSASIEQLRGWVGLSRRDHAFPVLDVVLDLVLAEGSPSAQKMSLLRQLAAAMRISDMELIALMAMKGYAWNTASGSGPGATHGDYVPPRRHSQGPDPYVILGISRDADERTIKRAYRKLISEHHPDRLGDLPEDMRRRAEMRASDINAAYERIKTDRGFK